MRRVNRHNVRVQTLRTAARPGTCHWIGRTTRVIGRAPQGNPITRRTIGRVRQVNGLAPPGNPINPARNGQAPQFDGPHVEVQAFTCRVHGRAPQQFRQALEKYGLAHHDFGRMSPVEPLPARSPRRQGQGNGCAELGAAELRPWQLREHSRGSCVCWRTDPISGFSVQPSGRHRPATPAAVRDHLPQPGPNTLGIGRRCLVDFSVLFLSSCIQGVSSCPATNSSCTSIR